MVSPLPAVPSQSRFSFWVFLGLPKPFLVTGEGVEGVQESLIWTSLFWAYLRRGLSLPVYLSRLGVFFDLILVIL